jgi:hypothetical membrane protein
MAQRGTGDRLTDLLLWIAVAIPFFYYGTQLVAARFYPGYDFRLQVASELGSDRAPTPGIFNAGVLLVGLGCLLAALGYYRGLVRAGGNRVLTGLVAAALVSAGAASLWAGTYHLPDPRHNPGALGAGMFVFTPLLLAAVWRLNGSRNLMLLLVAALLGVALLAPFMSGAFGPQPPGLFQRLFAATFFLPIAFGALFLLHCPAARRLRADG